MSEGNSTPATAESSDTEKPWLSGSSRSMDPKQTPLLDPENPILEKFQKALKEHLLRNIEHIKEEIFEYETGVKKNNARREELGIMVYDTQQIVKNQQTTLNEYIAKLQTTTAAREELENVLVEKRAVCKKEHSRLYEAEAREMELRREIEGVNLLIHQMSRWEEDLESDLNVKKRVYEKTQKEKGKLLEEKRMQDALIYKLMTRIWQLEQELDRMDVQMKLKVEEREELAQTVALGNTNIEAMEAEYRCLMHSWHSVVIAIGNRDRVLACLGAEMKKCEEKFKSIVAEIESIKKLSQKEMKKNEELTVLKNRFASHIQNCKGLMDAELQKKNAIERRMAEMAGIIEQTEADIKSIVEETNETENLVATLAREAEQLDNQKGEMEERIMRELENQVTSNKTLSALRRVLKQLKTKNREYEIQVALTENKIANVTSEIESQRFANFESQKYLDELELQLRELGKEADRYQEELKKMDLRIHKRQREVDLLNNKLQKLIERADGDGTSTSPMKAKITTLERDIEEIQEENKRLQQFWLREQTNLLKISEERQEQIQTNNLLRKQILILEQKNLKVTDDLESCKKQQDKVMRNINNLHKQLFVMGDNFVKTKGLKISMDKDNEVLRQDYVYKLKDAELECLQLQDEITQIEEDKVTMSNELIEMNREALEWERRLLSAKEAKATMLEERSKEGEVGSMKAEIHRMNVRYSQLKKVQDVLVHDLEHCVSRRDAIMTLAEAREKRHKGAGEKTRINFTRKMDDMRNKTKQMENQIEEMKKKMEKMEAEKREVEEKIKRVETEIDEAKEDRIDAERELEEAITKRQMNFELLLQLQKKLNIYTDLSKGRSPHVVYKSERSLTAEYSKEIDVNSKLTRIVENLQEDFPSHVHELNRISNTLKIPVYVYYQ